MIKNLLTNGRAIRRAIQAVSSWPQIGFRIILSLPLSPTFAVRSSLTPWIQTHFQWLRIHNPPRAPLLNISHVTRVNNFWCDLRTEACNEYGSLSFTGREDRGSQTFYLSSLARKKGRGREGEGRGREGEGRGREGKRRGREGERRGREGEGEVTHVHGSVFAFLHCSQTLCMDVTLKKILELKEPLWHPGHQLVHSCKICSHQQTHTQHTTSQSTFLFLSSPPFLTIISVHTE